MPWDSARLAGLRSASLGVVVLHELVDSTASSHPACCIPVQSCLICSGSTMLWLPREQRHYIRAQQQQSGPDTQVQPLCAEADCDAGGLLESTNHAINFDTVAYLELLGLTPWYLPPSAHR